MVLSARRLERLETIVADITAQGGNATAYQADVTCADDIARLIADSQALFGKIDVLINNAGVMKLAPIVKGKIDEWDNMIDINIKGVLYGIHAALPVFLSQQHGHFINLSSVAGLRVFAGLGSVYSGTKFAVKAISDGLREELAGSNVKVTTIYPGSVNSELKFGNSDSDTQAMVEAFYQANQIDAKHIAHAVAYAIAQPSDVGINDITVRPAQQAF